MAINVSVLIYILSINSKYQELSIILWQLIKKQVILKFVEVLFVETIFDGTVSVVSIISWHVMTESWITLAKYLPFLQLHVVGFHIKSFSQTCFF